MQVLTEALDAPLSAPHKLWTREECQRLEAAGLLEPGEYELIEGDLLKKLGKVQPHNRALQFLIHWLQEVFGWTFVLQEPTIDLRPEDNASSEPEPDAVVLKLPNSDLTDRPAYHQTQFVAEVSGPSLRLHLSRKARLYALSQIPEYWVLDVATKHVIVHRQPNQGAYQSIIEYSGDDMLSALGHPEKQIRARDLF